MKNIEVVAAVIHDNEKRILCAQKSGQDDETFKWEFPGGKVEPFETPKEALRREIKEELCLDIEVNSLIKETTHEDRNRYIIFKAYSATVIKGSISENVHHQIKWVDISDLHNFDWLDADKDILDDIIKYVNINL